MKNKNTALAITTVIFGISCYVFSPPLVLISFVPLIYILYCDNKMGWLYYIGIISCGCAIAFSPLILYSIPVYLISTALGVFFVGLFAVLSKFFVMKYNYGRVTFLIPPLVWMLLYISINPYSLMSSAFDIGAQIPYSAPLIWYIGSSGITFLLILMQSSIAYYLARKDKFTFALGIGIILAFSSCFIYSNLKDPEEFTVDRKGIKVALIQGNIREKWGWLQKNPYLVLETYSALSLEAAREKPDLIVWPEFALPLDFINYNKEVRDAVNEIILSSKSAFLIGSILYDERTKLHEDVALLFDKKANLIDYYSSVSPAPFNKFIKKSKSKLKSFMDGAGIMVCWEEINGSISRKYVNNLDSTYLVSISNNQDLDRTWLKRFNSFYSRARAAENKRYLVRCTNTGITQIVSPLGVIVKKIRRQESGILIGEVYPISEKTFYSRYGDIPVKTALLFILTYLLFVRNRPKG